MISETTPRQGPGGIQAIVVKGLFDPVSVGSFLLAAEDPVPHWRRPQDLKALFDD